MSENQEPGARVDLEEYKNEKEEFASTLDEIFKEENRDLSDEELDKKLDEKLGKKDEPSGEGTGDPETDPTKAESGLGAKSTEDDPTSGQDPVDPTPATSVVESDVDWKVRAEEAEAALTKEKQKTSSWNGRITAANKRVKELEAQLAAIPSEEDLTDQAKISKFRDEFPELGDVVDVMQRKIDKALPTAPPEQGPDPVVDPESTTTEDDDTEPTDHYVLTRKAHPDLDEAVNSGVLLTWINKQEAYIQPHLKAIYNGGSAKQVIDMVSEFKTKSGWTSQLDTKQGHATSKLKSMLAADGSESPGPVDRGSGPDMNDYAAAAKEAGLT